MLVQSFFANLHVNLLLLWCSYCCCCSCCSSSLLLHCTANQWKIDTNRQVRQRLKIKNHVQHEAT